MILSALCSAAGLFCPAGAEQIAVSGICTDSAELAQGTLFVCVRGAHNDGHDHLAKAAAQGACAAVIAQEYQGEIPEGLLTIRVPDTREALAYLYDAWCGKPTEKMKFVGVTGTNGKTSVAWLLYGLLRYAQIPCALIGTVRCEACGTELAPPASGCANMTTPEPAQLYPMLAKAAQMGTQVVVMEVTSHALAQHRCAPIRFALGVYTNLTRDHLDYHGSMEAYIAAKKKLLAQCEQVVLNIDDRAVAALGKESPCRVYTCSASNPSADFFARQAEVSFSGVQYKLMSANACVRVGCNTGGQFSVINSIEAAACGLLLGIKAQRIKDGMITVPPVPGRMERVVAQKDVGFDVLIDYAHTPDALESLLHTVCKLKMRSQRVVLVFGCGGDRDKGKRAQMGQIASRWADYFVITADNSRSEPTEEIVADIVRGVDRRAHYRIIRDREQAIRHVMMHAKAGDVILLAGKGHETYEISQNTRRTFDERQIVQQVLDECRRNVCENTELGE